MTLSLGDLALTHTYMYTASIWVQNLVNVMLKHVLDGLQGLVARTGEVYRGVWVEPYGVAHTEEISVHEHSIGAETYLIRAHSRFIA